MKKIKFDFDRIVASVESYFSSVCAERGRALMAGRPDPFPGTTFRDDMMAEARRRRDADLSAVAVGGTINWDHFQVV